MPVLFLKQFLDVSCSTKACYQAIVEASLNVTPRSYSALPEQDYRLEVHDWASHPITSDLGLPAGSPLVPELAFRAEIDFDVELGREIWRAPT